MGMTIDKHTCDTCKYGEWYRHGYDITMMDDECGGCCSWNDKWEPSGVIDDGKIDNAIRELEILKKNTFSYMSAYQAFTTAVNIMRKYKKIAQILKDIPYGGEATVRRIQEVVEDATN